MLLQCKESSLKPSHPEGVHSGVCVDVIDLGIVEGEFDGKKSRKHKLRLLFETEALAPDGKRFILGKSFTASLHQQARLTEFLSKWRGRPINVGEVIDLSKLIGVSCTLVVNHVARKDGRVFASIDAVTKPTKKVTPSGAYDPDEARRKIEEWKAGNVNTTTPVPQPPATTPTPVSSAPLAALGAALEAPEDEIGF